MRAGAVAGCSLRLGRGVYTFAHLPRPLASVLTSLRQTHRTQGYEGGLAQYPNTYNIEDWGGRGFYAGQGGGRRPGDTEQKLRAPQSGTRSSGV